MLDIRRNLFNVLGLPGSPPRQPTAFDTLLKDVLAEEFRVLVCDEAQLLREESFRLETPSARSLRDEGLKERIQKVYTFNYLVYGARKIWRELNRQGHAVACCTVERDTDSRPMRMGMVHTVRWRTCWGCSLPRASGDDSRIGTRSPSWRSLRERGWLSCAEPMARTRISALRERG